MMESQSPHQVENSHLELPREHHRNGNMTEAKDNSSGVDLETVTVFRDQAALSGADSRPNNN